jgi:hypothetical protein
MAFIHACYRPGHVLSTSRELFDWQYGNGAGCPYNMALAFDTTSSNLLGILGFIDSRRYDARLAGDNCLWLALWQVRPDAGTPTLGLALLAFVRQHVPHAVVAVAGVRAGVTSVYRALGFVVTGFRHYYMLNPEVTEFRLAVVPDRRVPLAIPSSTPIQLQRIGQDDLQHLAESRTFDPERAPRKSARYFGSRYLAHPFYEYTVYLVCRAGEPVGLLSTRIASQDRARALRVVDMLLASEDVAALGPALHALLRQTGCEYADLVQHGVEADHLRRAGFLEVNPDAGVVIPNYFEPFVRENRPVTLCYRARDGRPPAGFVAFRGDGDQDRPNVC